MKKLLLSLATITTVVTPIATVVSCVQEMDAVHKTYKLQITNNDKFLAMNQDAKRTYLIEDVAISLIGEMMKQSHEHVDGLVQAKLAGSSWTTIATFDVNSKVVDKIRKTERESDHTQLLKSAITDQLIAKVTEAIQKAADKTKVKS